MKHLCSLKGYYTMLRPLQQFAFLLMICGALTGFVWEHLQVLRQVDPSCLVDCDPEQKDNSGTKKLGEDDKLGPETYSFGQSLAVVGSKYLKTIPPEPSSYYSSGHLTIWTPPPELR